MHTVLMGAFEGSVAIKDVQKLGDAQQQLIGVSPTHTWQYLDF